MPAPSPRLVDVDDFEARIEQALVAFEPVRSSQTPIQLDVDSSGLVRLKGWVRSRVIKDSIEDIVRHVPGVTSVELELVADPELEVDVARALAKAPETSGLEPGSVILRSTYGSVLLTGSIPSAEMRDRVAQVVSQVDGVRRVDDELQIKGAVGEK
jgi:osmotically-inducible protein OsmY